MFITLYLFFVVVLIQFLYLNFAFKKNKKIEGNAKRLEAADPSKIRHSDEALTLWRLLLLAGPLMRYTS